jgi:hypothetical protein
MSQNKITQAYVSDPPPPALCSVLVGTTKQIKEKHNYDNEMQEIRLEDEA